MKTIILYATKSGAARECAELLAAKIADCCIYDLSKQTPDIGDADTVILGSGVRMGKIYRPVRKFIDKNIDKLLSKRMAVYLCNSEPGTYEKAVGKNFPAPLIVHSLCVMSFGGKKPFASTVNQDWVVTDNVRAFVQAVEQGESIL
jgi:menaquinone-dependent protoporphyrinogen oxidase